MERIGRVDVALVAVSASYLNTVTVPQALEHVRTYKPDVYIPAHHDAAYNNLWRATEPLFQAVKDENPNIVTVSQGLSRADLLQHRAQHQPQALRCREASTPAFAGSRRRSKLPANRERLNPFANGRRNDGVPERASGRYRCAQGQLGCSRPLLPCCRLFRHSFIAQTAARRRSPARSPRPRKA